MALDTEPLNGMEACGDACSCLTGGYCERHHVRKSIHAVKLCRERTGYFRKYEEGRGLGQLAKNRGRVSSPQLSEPYGDDDPAFIANVLCPSCEYYRPASRRCYCGKCAKGVPVERLSSCPAYKW